MRMFRRVVLSCDEMISQSKKQNDNDPSFFFCFYYVLHAYYFLPEREVLMDFYIFLSPFIMPTVHNALSITMMCEMHHPFTQFITFHKFHLSFILKL